MEVHCTIPHPTFTYSINTHLCCTINSHRISYYYYLRPVESTALSSDGSAHARYKSWRAGLLLMKIAPREQRVAGALFRYDLPSVRGGSYLSAVAGRIARSSPVTRQLIRYYSYSDRIYQPAVSLSENEKRQEIVGSYNIYLLLSASHGLVTERPAK